MHISTLILPLLAAVPAISAAKLVSNHGARRHAAAHLTPDFNKLRREGTAAMEAREGISGVSSSMKGKRLVRKKRSGNSACQQPFSNSTLASSSSSSINAGASSTTSLASSGSSTTASSSTTSIGTSELAGAVSSSTTSVRGAASSTTTSAWSDAASSTTTSAAWSAAASTTAFSTTTSSSTSPSSTSNSDWKHVETYAGNNFFDNFQFWSWDDPTHGTVNFQDAGNAWNNGLVSVDSNGHAFMRVDTTENVSGGRQTIRISANLVWTGGMVLMDAYHMPTGCGTWPAWWQNGPNWPAGGEIDILEGINAFTQNQVSLHTGPGCTMPSDMNNNQLSTLTTGNYNSYDCASVDTSNQGCGSRDQTNDNSYGTGFNNVNGGVYAMVWDKVGIRVWFFQRSNIPSDITNETPDPTGWGTPVAFFPADNCAPYTYFYDHYNIFDTTLCGDWAGADAVWNYAGYAGQDQSCAAMTGYSTCSDFVLNSGSSFADAYWEIASVKYFNSTSQV